MAIDVTGVDTVSQTLTIPTFNTTLGAYDLEDGASLIIQGAVTLPDTVDGDTETGVQTEGSGAPPSLYIASGASLTVSSQGMNATAYGFYTQNGVNGQTVAANFENHGTFTVDGETNATAVTLLDGGSFTNAGAIVVSTLEPGLTVGLQTDVAGLVTNSGTLTVTGPGAIGVSAATFGGGTIVNSGSITVTDTSGQALGAALQLGDPVGGVETVVNSGTITADYAIEAISYVSMLTSSTNLDLTNTGTINGQIFLADGSGSEIYNTGAINGVIQLSNNGNDLYDGRGGTQTGGIYLGGGTDTVYLGNDGETVVGGTGTAIIVGGTGNDTITGGSGNATIDGGGGNDVLTGGGGIDTIIFKPGYGYSEITDFTPGQGSHIDVSAFAGFYSLNQVLANASMVNGNTVIAFSGGSITLDNVQESSLTAADFIFSPAAPDIVGSTASYANATAGVTVSLALQGQAQNTIGAGVDTLNNIQYLIGSAYDDTLSGGVGTLGLYGGAGDDLFLVKTGTFNPGEVIDGGTGINTLEAIGSLDFSAGSLANIENLMFAPDPSLAAGTAQSVTVSAAEVASGLAPNLAVTGSSAPDTLIINGAPGTALDLSGWTFTNWSANDAIQFNGSGGSEALTLSAAAAGAGGYVIQMGPSDTLTLAPATGGAFQAGGAIVVDDFQSGVGGDVLNLASYLNSVLQGYTPGSDPFAGGFVRVVLSGSDTLLQIDPNGGSDGFTTLLTLKNVDPNSLTAANLGGLTPNFTPVATITGSGTLNGTGSDDLLQGGAGNDILHPGAGSDHLDGGGGVNTALYNGLYLDYAVSVSGSSGAVSGGPEGGTDTLANIQRIQFVDGFLATSPTDTAGQVYRLYEATLDRAPDPEGLANWVHALDGGESLQSVASGFVNSTEFQTTYGALDNTDFVTLLYDNVLHRAPDASGLANWVGELNSGADTRAQVVLGFSESQEDIAALAAPVEQGLWVQDAGAAEVARLYDTVLGRLPDAAGEINWTQLLDSGTDTLLQVTQGFVGSTEFQSVYGNLDNSDFVNLLYENTLHRAADPTGLANWVAELNSGTSRAQVVEGFSESPEHIANTAAHIDQGVWFI